MLSCSSFKSAAHNAGRQDVPLANQLKATREKVIPQASHTYPSLAESHSSFGASDRGGSVGRQPDDRMYAEPNRRTETNHDVHEPLSSREHVQCTFECVMHIDSTRDAFAGGGGS